MSLLAEYSVGEFPLPSHSPFNVNPQPSPEQIIQIGSAFWASKTLLSAVELDVFTELAREPGTLENLQDRLGLHPRSARDFLDALVALGFLVRRAGHYANTPATDLYLDKAKSSYIGGILEMASQRLYRFWDNLPAALRSGEMQNEAKHGEQSLLEEIYADPALLKQYMQAMTGFNRGANLVIATQFPWQRYHTFVDVGTAQGDLAVQVARANPHLRGTGLDLPVVKPIFNAYAAQQEVADRVQFVSGDFFAHSLPLADVIVMGHILHDWDLAQKKHLIRSAYAALPLGGALIAYDAIIDDDRRYNAFGLLMSLNMLIETPGGFDYTGADCKAWMKEAGFRETYVQHLTGPDSMVVGIK
jgi:hypothetical protein